MRRCSILLPIVALALLAGCGGDDSSSSSASTAAPAPKPAESTVADAAYASRADAICRRALAETRQLGREFFQQAPPSNGDILGTVTEYLVAPGIKIRERMADRLRALPPPTEGAAAVAAYTELFGPLTALSYQRLQAGRAGDSEEASRYEGLMLELAEEQTAAARLAGLDDCAANFVNAALR